MSEDRLAHQDREVEFFDSVYGEGAYNPTGNRIKSERELRCILRASPAGRLGRVLSIGCGDGEFERLLAPQAEKVIALDISPQAVEVAARLTDAQGIQNVDFECLSVFDLNWEERFDTVICLAFLHHVPEADIPSLLERVFQHLEPGGMLYSQDPNVKGLLRAVGRVVLGSHYDQYHTPDERELDPDELRDSLRSAGFDSVEIIPIDLTVIPAMYMLAKWPGWILHVLAGVDRIFCASPLRRWASGFAAVSRKSGGGDPR
ncbi:MAG: methyltransferase domain-containing protein [Myxococcota bacterium]|nr:methyltransferase domain-containing protein [Myxococcota bacterium]